MEFSLPSYLFQLIGVPSEDDMDLCSCEVLEELFESKYAECIEIYWLIKKYSPYIVDLSYSHKQNKKLKSLTITMRLKEIDTKQVITELESAKIKGYQLKVTSEKSGICINIRKKK